MNSVKGIADSIYILQVYVNTNIDGTSFAGLTRRCLFHMMGTRKYFTVSFVQIKLHRQLFSESAGNHISMNSFFPKPINTPGVMNDLACILWRDFIYIQLCHLMLPNLQTWNLDRHQFELPSQRTTHPIDIVSVNAAAGSMLDRLLKRTQEAAALASACYGQYSTRIQGSSGSS
jgi:hypothetical protein